MAVGILTFALTGLLGTFAIGTGLARESVRQVQATHILQTIIAERRARPTANDANLVLPVLSGSSARDSSNPISLDELGCALPTTRSGMFGMVYRIGNPTTDSATVYCAVYWPGQAVPVNAQGRVEMQTTVTFQTSQ